MAQTAADWLEWLTRASLPVVAACLLGVYVQTEKQTILLNVQAKDVADLKAELAAVKAGHITRLELAETMRRVDQQLEIILLRARTKQ